MLCGELMDLMWVWRAPVQWSIPDRVIEILCKHQIGNL